MEVQPVFRCPCNKKTYESQKKLKLHQKTQGHKSWIEHEELREIKIELTRRDNKITKLGAENMFLREYVEELLRKNIKGSVSDNKKDASTSCV